MYLDNAATTRVSKKAIDAMIHSMDLHYGNPSSIHAFGLMVEREIHHARHNIAHFLKTEPKNIVFTSGATESSNMVLQSIVTHAQSNKRHMITTQIEHPSVLEVFKSYENKGFKVTYLPCNQAGKVSCIDLIAALTPETFLVSIMMVNNEVGSIQPISELCAAAKSYSDDIFFHTDAVQALGKIEFSLERLNVDAASFSAHKLHGPKGVGALYLKTPYKLHPMVYGGRQEGNLRSGTENVPGILGFSEALIDFQNKRERILVQLALLKSTCIDFVTEYFKEVIVLSPLDDFHSDAIVSIAFRNVKSEVLVHELEKKGIYVSSGSACSSNKEGAISHVTTSMKIPKEYREGVIRISFSGEETMNAFVDVLQQILDTVNEHRKFINWRRK